MTLTTGSSGGLGGGAPNFPISAGLEAAGLSAAANMQILLQTNNDLMIAIHKTLLETTQETSRKIESLRDDVRDIKLNLQKNDNTLKEEATNWRAHTELLLKEQGERHNQDISRLMDMLMKLVISDAQTTKQSNSAAPVTIPASILKAATVTAPTVTATTTPTLTVATIAPAPTVTTTTSASIVATTTPIVATTTPIMTAPVVTAAAKSEPAPTPTIVTVPKPVVTSPAQNFKTVTAPTVTTSAFASPFQQASVPIVTTTASASPFQQIPTQTTTIAGGFGAFQQIPTQTTTVGVGNFGLAGGGLFGGGAKGGNTSFADIAKKTSEGVGGLFGGGIKPQFGTSPFNPTAAQAPNFKFFSPQQPSLNGSVHSKATDENRGEDESDKEGETPEDEDYTPDVHYDPVIELPPEVEVVSGEENEEVLFQARCKLYRYDREAKENKERGLGDIKILKNLATQKYRCIMRREKVLKLCANFPIVGEFKLHKREQMPTVYTWACKDFSENLQSGEDETFSVRFKDVTIANEFNEKMMEAVEQMKTQE